MKKFEMNAKQAEVKPVAIEFGIKWVGVKTTELINQVNAEIDKRNATNAEKPAKTPKKTLADYGLAEGQVVTIAGFEVKGKTILVGRQVSITRLSRANGYIKGRLVNDVDGTLQKTEIAITMDIIIDGLEKKEEAVA